MEAFPKLTVEVLELIDAGDFVIASTIFHGQGSRSGAQVEDAYVYVYKMRDGLIVEGWECRTREEALKAVGLEE